MKPAPDNRLSYGLRMIRTWIRVRNFRGHNVHSPFTYALIRGAILPRRLSGTDDTFYRAALSAGLPRRAAIRLQNLRDHCPDHRWIVVDADQTPPDPQAGKSIRCILHPRLTKNRFETCRKLIAAHPGTSIDNRAYILLFDDAGLSKKHYKL